ncbi:MAG: DUF892 family protein [Rhodospirillaceae bacterium]|nr:DUF892 family protein [Rhodospirillaceae bacterium]
MTMMSVQDLLLDELHGIYDAERQLIRALPRMARAAKSGPLRQALEHHLAETRAQVQRLEQAFDTYAVQPRGKPCEAMRSMLADATALMLAIGIPEVLDAALIATVRKIESYEIACYRSIHALAMALGGSPIAQHAADTIAEEAAFEQALDRIAASGIHKSALAAAPSRPPRRLPTIRQVGTAEAAPTKGRQPDAPDIGSRRKLRQAMQGLVDEARDAMGTIWMPEALGATPFR